MPGPDAPRSLLIGWGNASASQLAAYERLHASLGLRPTSVIPSAARGLLGPGAYGDALAPTAEQLARVEPGPLLVHLFSDNGFIGWAALLARLAENAAGRRVRASIVGVVLDSAPGLWAARGRRDFARRFALGMTPAVSRALGLGPREDLPLATPLLRGAFLGYQLLVPRAVTAMLSAERRVAAAQPRCPHLVLYGGRDRLVPSRDVEAWIERQRGRDIDVEAELFADARHVALYPSDPARYRAAITRFVTRVLR
jgi:alpha-beta hydrolase superfamily lysophospholipase